MAQTLSPEDVKAIAEEVLVLIQESALNYETTIDAPTTATERARYSVPVVKDASDTEKRVANNVNLNNMVNAWAADIIQLNSQAAEDLQTLGTLEDNVKALASQVSSDASKAAGSKEAAESARDAAQQAEQDAEASKTAAASSANSAASSKSAAKTAEGNVEVMKGQIETLKAQIEDSAQSKNVLPVLIDGEVKGLSIIANASGVMIDLSDIEESGTTETA